MLDLVVWCASKIQSTITHKSTTTTKSCLKVFNKNNNNKNKINNNNA